MDKNMKYIVEQYVSDHSEEQIELLRTLGKIPAAGGILPGLAGDAGGCRCDH